MVQKNNKTNFSGDSIVINSAQGNECRVAIIRNGQLDELHVERVSSSTNVGNIYRGRIVNIESSIQAVFVDYGEGENGFLHISDVHPRYFLNPEVKEKVGKKVSRKERPPIQDVFNKGDEVLVQVLKEGVGGKGPSLTSYISMPGRYVVMMPYMDRIGISRRIEDESKRREMKKILDTLNLPKGAGFILRTAGFGRSKSDLKRDVAYLMRMWKVMEERQGQVDGPCQIYSESDIAFRSIRDLIREDISKVYVDTFDSCQRIRSFLSLVSPRSYPDVYFYNSLIPIFESFGIEKEIRDLQSREVVLPSGGRLVIDQTEALVSIDVNSGKSRSASTSEENATSTNLEAAAEICRQLKLRDLGGLVVCDFIDMIKISNRKKVEQLIENSLKKDRASTQALPINKFGLLVLTRQRIRPSIEERDRYKCDLCLGRGSIARPDVSAGDAIRKAAWILNDKEVYIVEIACSGQVASSMLGAWRQTINDIEKKSSKRIIVRVSESIEKDRVALFAYGENGTDISISKIKKPVRPSDQKLKKNLNEVGVFSANILKKSKEAPMADATNMALIEDLEEEIKSLGRKKVDKTKNKKELIPAEQAIRVYQLAKELGLTSKEVLDRCKKDSRLNLRSHVSSVPSDLVTIIKGLFKSDAKKNNVKKDLNPKKSDKNKSEKSRVNKIKKVKKRIEKKETKKIKSNKKKVQSKATRKKKIKKQTDSNKSSGMTSKSVSSKRTLYATRRRVTPQEVQDRNKEDR